MQNPMTALRFAAASTTELAAGQFKRCRHAAHDILLANIDHQYYAVANLCSHEDAPLHLGCLKNGEIQCTLHGARFDVRNGKPTQEPADEAIETFTVIVEEETVWIELPEI